MAKRRYMTMMEINAKVNPIIDDVLTIKTDVTSLNINKADNIHTHSWSAITNKPNIPADNSATVTSLSGTVSDHTASITKLQASRATVAALTNVPNMPTQGGSLTVLGLTVVSFQDFQNLWNYCQQLGNRIQSIITAHRPA